MPMSAQDVVEVMNALRLAGARAWLDGGWGVDALLREQTREHDDLDLVVPWPSVSPTLEAAQGDVSALIVALGALGYGPHRTDEFPCSFVLRASGDRRVDVHPVVMDADGGAWQAQRSSPLPSGGEGAGGEGHGMLIEQGWKYTADGLHAVGLVGGREFACLSPELQVRCHSGYELDEGDREDVRRLCERFAILVPEELR